jgi:membrane fusion protein (multidrug efflux system)
MSFSKKITYFSIVVISIFVGYFFWNKSRANHQKNNLRDLVIEVTVSSVKKNQVQLFHELPARVEAYRISQVRPRVEGVVRKIKFEEGSFVKAGQQLYEIESEVYQSAFEKAQANLKSVGAKKTRYQALLEEGAISKQEFDDINASFAEAKDIFTKAKTSLNYSKVYAQISGYIGKSNFTEGSLVTANQIDPLTTITQLDPIYVDMSQPTKDAMGFYNQKKIPVSLVIEDQNYEVQGMLRMAEVFADDETDSVRLRSLFSNKDKKLIPGMFVTAKIHLKPFDAITVPQRATIRLPDGNLAVWKIEEGNIAKQVLIKTDQVFEDQWVVSDGLEEGDVIIYEGYQKITDGAKVNPVQLETQEKK